MTPLRIAPQSTSFPIPVPPMRARRNSKHASSFAHRPRAKKQLDAHSPSGPLPAMQKGRSSTQ
eukprot:CAMPEP_0174350578 /NCGR_PEP_ID=MMETSP0811_2-20130205/7700_1 /TAXON_ID=73025 ORGANISM="Eutreptiella gymnastica-like, Strain CCMP1594" /NCGR_SAMPLE_ID=MMETSP0811_2 /ASSEMBLY_ACC=CAM_ASM_000667 /LENGTH=62 /DNA_ID=CAMNT_0015479023 /DNA_START=109 /DNA_END=297 /DNA_ORIENTATION=-